MPDPPALSDSEQRGENISSPTPSPPLVNDQSDAEFKSSRKREREVSLEPATTPSASQDIDASPRERKDSTFRAPAKKNRRRLDPTVEEDDSNTTPRSRSHSGSPPLPVAVSPRAEMRIKVRQISQGVGDLNWRNMQPQQGDDDELMHDGDTGKSKHVPGGEGLQEAAVILEDKHESSDRKGDSSHATEPIVVDAPHTHSHHSKDASDGGKVGSNSGTDIVVDAPHDSPHKDKDDSGDKAATPSRTEAIVVDAAHGESTHGGKPAKEAVHDQTPEARTANPEVVVDPAPTSKVPLAVSSETTTLRSDAESGSEKMLKRKFLERSTSTGPSEESSATSTTGKGMSAAAISGQSEGINAKPSTPSPEGQTERTSPPSPKMQKLSGFAAYASFNSPFSKVKGNVLASSSKSSLAPSSSAPQLGESSSMASGFASYAGSASPFASVSRDQTPVVENQQPVGGGKRSIGGFGSFAGSTSPFASVRAKSPALGGGPSKLGRAKSPPGPRRNNSFSSSAFGSYASGGAQAFGSGASSRSFKGEEAIAANPLGSKPSTGSASFGGPAAKSTFGEKPSDEASASKEGEDTDENDEDGDEDESSTFGARLRAAGTGTLEDEPDDEVETQKMALEEQDVITGEEDEEIMMQVRGKLFELDGVAWKERGTGIMKLLVNRADGSNPRLVMRKDAVYTLLVNVQLFHGMKCVFAQDPRYVRFSAILGGKTTHYNLRLPNTKIAQEFLEEVNMCIASV